MSQQFVVTHRNDSKIDHLGDRATVLNQLAALNTAPDKPGEDILWGPGFRLEMASDQDPIVQMLLTVTEEEIAWLSMVKVAKSCQWRIIDLQTGVEVEPT